MGKVSLQDVADRLGISRVTVSKVVNNQPGVALATRKKVLQRLEAEGYKKFNPEMLKLLEGNPSNKAAAKPLADKNIAVVVTNPHFSPFWLEIINGIARSLDEQACHLVYHFLDRDEERQHKIPKQLKNSNLDAMIVLNIYDSETTEKLESLDIPSVFLDVCPEVAKKRLKGDLLLLEGCKSLYSLTEMLLSQGQKELGFIGDIHYSETIRHRWAGFSAALRSNNVPIKPEYCLIADDAQHFYEQQSLFATLSKLKKQPEAWLCANDHIAYMVYQFLQRNGFRVPQDVSLTGFDNISNPMMPNLQLTTVSLDAQYIGQRLVSQLLMRLQHPQMPAEVVHIEPEITYGNSTRDIATAAEKGPKLS